MTSMYIAFSILLIVNLIQQYRIKLLIQHIKKINEYIDNNQHNVIELRKDVDTLYINAMEQAIKYYESIEDYNSCNILKNRITELNQRIKDLK
jgi:phosphopantetheine adenylyltransferase